MGGNEEAVASSGNVFADFGNPNPELARTKSRIAIEIIRIMRAKGMTQSEAAEIFGTHQPRVSNIVRGRLREFSLETLLAYLGKLGTTIDITVQSPEMSRSGGPIITRIPVTESISAEPWTAGPKSNNCSEPMAAASHKKPNVQFD
jgi:predicted XRE-type DNA-binding protein